MLCYTHTRARTRRPDQTELKVSDVVLYHYWATYMEPDQYRKFLRGCCPGGPEDLF